MSKTLGSLPAGALVKDTGTKYNSAAIIWRVLGHDHDGSGTTTLESRDIITLKCFDAKESSNSNSTRKQWGNNRYKHSNLLQWLNSDAASWYTAQHTADAPPSSKNVWKSGSTSINPYDTEAGFLTNLSADFKTALQTVSKKTVLNTVTDGGSYENVSSKIFLLSTTEVGFANESSIAEGTIYAYYSENNTDERRKKNLANNAAKGNYSSATSPFDWWLRTPSSNSSSTLRHVDIDGEKNITDACTGNYGVSPACALLSSLKVSDTTDSGGVYTILWNEPPKIVPGSKNIGNVSSAPTLTLSITEPESESFTGVVKLDGTQKDTFSGTASKTYTVPISTWWAAMTKAQHTIQVVVTDSKGNATTENYTLTKTNSAPAKPTISSPTGGMRRESDFYVQFKCGTDADGDTQVPKVQISSKSTFATVTEITAFEMQKNGAWAAATEVTNANVGNNLRAKVTNQTAGTKLYIRIASLDSGSGITVYSDAQQILIGDVLEVISPAEQRTEKPVMIRVIYKGVIASGAATEVFVTNNANDEEPVWEKYTGHKHTFTNEKKTADRWATAAKIKITAGNATGEISISAIGTGVV